MLVVTVRPGGGRVAATIAQLTSQGWTWLSTVRAGANWRVTFRCGA
jgi:hypothetical protein